MELRQLRYFLAACRHLNFTRAAAEVHIAQPPFGRQIAALEGELGTKLLTRSRAGMSLTPAGSIVAARAKEILASVRGLELEVQALVGKAHRTFRIGTTPWLLYGNLSLGIAFLRTELPELEVDLTVHPAAELTRRVLADDIDMAVGAAPSEDSSVEEVVVRHDSHLLAVPPGHRLSETGSKHLSSQGEVLIRVADDGAVTEREAALLLREVQVEVTRTLVTQELGSALGLVASGFGISIVPSLAARMRSNDVSYVDIGDLKTPVRLSARRGRNSVILHKVARKLVGLAEEKLRRDETWRENLRHP